MNKQILKGLEMIKEGICLILAENVSECPKETPVVSDVTPASVSEEKEELSPEKLDSMSYTEIKKLAKSLNLPAKGSREELVEIILESQGVSTATKVSEEVEPEEVEPEEVEPEEVEPEEVEPEEEETSVIDPVYDAVMNAVSGMSNEEIADILADVGISAKGKRQTLIDKLIQAVNDGLIELDDEEGEVSDSSDGDEDEEVEPASPNNEDDESDDESDDMNDFANNPNITEERANAAEKEDAKIRKQFKSGKVTRKTLVAFLQDFYDTDEDLSDMSDDEVLETYIDAICRMIDDDGNLVEEGAYMLNGEPACCGRHLVYSEDTGVYVCEHCGTEYEAEE